MTSMTILYFYLLFMAGLIVLGFAEYYLNKLIR